MAEDSRNRLTALFQDHAAPETVRPDKSFISYIADAGALIRVYPEDSPKQAAQYIRMALETRDPLVKYYDASADGGENFISFHIQGMRANAEGSLDSNAALATLRFYDDRDRPSELEFNPDMDDDDSALVKEGPSLNEFLKILDAARDWADMDFGVMAQGRIHPLLENLNVDNFKYKF